MKLSELEARHVERCRNAYEVPPEIPFYETLKDVDGLIALVREMREALQVSHDAANAMVGSLNIREYEPGKYRVDEPGPKVLEQSMKSIAVSLRTLAKLEAE